MMDEKEDAPTVSMPFWLYVVRAMWLLVAIRCFAAVIDLALNRESPSVAALTILAALGVVAGVGATVTED